MFGPIPGENYTSDTKNYPWHQPPQYTDISEALDKVVVKITEPNVAKKLVSLAQVDIPLYRIAALIVMEGVEGGLWTVDMGLLLIGPVTKIIEIMADNYGVPYKIGIEPEEDNTPTGLFVKMKYEAKQANRNGVIRMIKEELPEIKDQAAAQEAPAAGGEEEKTPDLQAKGFATMMKGKPEEGAQ
jgi:hypothetical protein